MTRSRPTRRAVLRGAAVSLALPYLPSLARGSVAEDPVKRVAFVYVPNGLHMPDWSLPRADRRATKRAPLPAALPSTLAVLGAHRERLTLYQGLTADKARANGDGPGDHARACAAYLTGTQPVKADGSIIRVGESADQLVARHVGDATRFRSLQLGLEGGRQSGQCDSGYPCAYSSNLSWSTGSTPLVHETRPRALFDRLFGDGLAHLSPEQRARRARLRESVLDFVARDAKRLSRDLSAADRRKLDEYLTAVRELEERLAHAGAPAEVDLERPDGTPRDFAAHADLMFELLALAFATDSTRVATFLVANEGSNRTYRELGHDEGHHSLSHHGKDADKQAAIAEINRLQLGAVARFLDRAAALETDGRSLLDDTYVVIGSGIEDGNTHAHHDLPQAIVGGGGGGEVRDFPRDTPLANLHRGLFDALGVPCERFGDATDVIAV